MATTPAAKKGSKGKGGLDTVPSPADAKPAKSVSMRTIDTAIDKSLKNKGGRPSDYTKEKGDVICELITEGKSLRYICKQNGMPSIATVFKWQRDNPEFLNQYVRAKEEQADTNAEDLQEIVDEVRTGKLDPQSARVAADILKWTSSKLKPKKYGDKLDLTSDGKQLPQPIISLTAAPEQEQIDA